MAPPLHMRKRFRTKKSRPMSTRKNKAVRSTIRRQIFNTRESKKQTISVVDNSVTNVGHTTSTGSFEIAQGNTSLTREGNEVYATSFCHKFVCHANTTGTNTSIIRLCLYIPKHNPSDVITGLTILSSVDTDKFVVLYDRSIELGYGSGHAFGAKLLTIKRKFKNAKKLYYTGASAAAPINPVMKWIWVSDQAASGKPPTLNAELINYFKD